MKSNNHLRLSKVSVFLTVLAAASMGAIFSGPAEATTSGHASSTASDVPSHSVGEPYGSTVFGGVALTVHDASGGLPTGKR